MDKTFVTKKSWKNRVNNTVVGVFYNQASKVQKDMGTQAGGGGLYT